MTEERDFVAEQSLLVLRGEARALEHIKFAFD